MRLKQLKGAIVRWLAPLLSWLEALVSRWQVRRRATKSIQSRRKPSMGTGIPPDEILLPPDFLPPLPPAAPDLLESADLIPTRAVTSPHWARTELYQDPRPIFQQEPFVPALYHREPEVVSAFGTSTPHSGSWLLHYGPRWEENLLGPGHNLSPVLLVPGAGVTSNRSFGKGPLTQFLEDAGHVVFAVTFAHGHGDNWQQAEVLANAIARIRAITGAPKVDVVAHSKGAVSARLYTSNMYMPGGTPYRQDVRRMILLGPPNNGIDIAFRHPLMFWFGSWFAGAPSPYIPPLRHSLYPGGAYPGQNQLVKVLRDQVPLRDPDRWNARRTYEGGWTLYGYSRGASWTAAAGGHLIDRLNEAGVEPDVEVAVLVGTRHHLQVDGVPILGESDATSDGLVFAVSALYTEGITHRGAPLLTVDQLHLNHIELITDPRALQWTLTQLN